MFLSLPYRRLCQFSLSFILVSTASLGAYADDGQATLSKAKAGDAYAQGVMGDNFQNGANGFSKDLVQAAFWAGTAALAVAITAGFGPERRGIMFGQNTAK